MIGRLTFAAATVWLLGCATADAQSIMRSPTINSAPRLPTVNPNVAPNPVAVGRVTTSVGRIGPPAGVIRNPGPVVTSRVLATPALPYAHYSPNLYPACGSAYRDSDGECLDSPVAGGGGSGVAGKKRVGSARRNTQQAIVPLRRVADELVAEIDGSLSDAQADALARRHGLARIALQNFQLLGAAIGLFRITDGRPLDAARRGFASDASVRSVQFNFRYLAQDRKPALREGDPAQYALAKLRLPEAHTLAKGANVRIAVIDSGIDAKHPELAGSIAESFDALDGKEEPHLHGTGVAGVIVSHARLMGSAPAAQLLAIRAFAQAGNTAESSSFAILKALDYATAHGARIVNMSFAGPKDPVVERAIAACAERGVTMIAAAGNAGPKSPPLYPAADPDVIAVSATDAQDRLFSASNRGSYVALTAPGVDIFLPAPDGKYQITSGTSFSAAYVSGLAALMLERDPALKPNEVRALLTKTARDLGSPGRDDLFGAGEPDAFAAVQAAIAASPAPTATSEPARPEKNAAETGQSRAVAASPTTAAEELSQSVSKGAAAQ